MVKLLQEDWQFTGAFIMGALFQDKQKCSDVNAEETHFISEVALRSGM